LKKEMSSKYETRQRELEEKERAREEERLRQIKEREE
jgi:hypothetical protein